MKKPTEPKQEDCCNSGCNPCIFDVYEKQLQLYESFKESGKTDSALANAISQLDYTAFYVENSIDLMNEHRLILFKQCNTSSDAERVVWNPGDHFLFKYLSKELNCTRAYTPVRIKIKEKYDFAILVKRYLNGVVSNHLCDLNIGDTTLWRGPYGHYKLIPNKFCRMIMIAQGTGIAPVYSIIKQVLNNEDDMTNIILFYCCKNLMTVLLRNELYSFKSYWNFHYEVYLSDKLKEPCKYQEPIIPHRLNISHINKLKTFTDGVFFIFVGITKLTPFISKELHKDL
ncbi:putative cytochrome b5 reductase 3-like protein, partial [Operophtera brumata]